MAAKTPKTSMYKWEGKNRQGAPMSGQMAGQDAALVKAQLRKQGINPIKVRKKGIEIFSAGKKITPMDVAVFTRQMATMMKAGVPLLQSFDIIIEGIENPNMRKLVDTVKQDVAVVIALPCHCVSIHSTLMICIATWWSLVNSRVHWRPCWIGWPPIRKKLKH